MTALDGALKATEAALEPPFVWWSYDKRPIMVIKNTTIFPALRRPIASSLTCPMLDNDQ